MVDVVGEPHGDAALCRAGECSFDDLREVVGEVEVVDRDLERVLRGGDEVGEGLGRLLGGLAAVGERAKLYRGAFIAALCARFAAW